MRAIDVSRYDLPSEKNTGNASIVPGYAVTAGSLGTWKVVYTAGDSGIAVRGGVRIAFDGMTGCGHPQMRNPAGLNYVHCQCSRREVKLVSEVVDSNSYYGWVDARGGGLTNGTECPGFPDVFVYLISISVMGQPMRKGDQIEVVIGETHNEGERSIANDDFNHFLGFQLPILAQDKYIFWMLEDSTGQGDYVFLAKQPYLRIEPSFANRARIVGPSCLGTNDQCQISVAFLDSYGNFCPAPLEEVELRAMPSGATEIMTLNTDNIEPDSTQVELPTPQYAYVEVWDLENSLVARSNPAQRVETGQRKVYWGDIHGHTIISDGQSTPADYYRYARDLAKLEFCAITDHASNITDKGWAEIRQQTETFNHDGHFVTLLGYEDAFKNHRTSGCHTHENIYFSGDCPVLHSPRSKPQGQKNIKQVASPTELWEKVRQNSGMIIYHTSHPLAMAQQNYSPQLHRLVEIYAKWGASEFYGSQKEVGFRSGERVQELLARGLRLGFVAGSDTHMSAPGGDLYEPVALRFRKAGLTAVMADSLSRENIWKSLYNRRCYATSGERIIVEVDIEDHEMGEEVEVAQNDNAVQRRNIRVRAIGTTGIEKITIVRNNKEIYQHAGYDQHVEFEYMDKEPLGNLSVADMPGSAYYYVRIIQEDEEMAWTSPIWFVLLDSRKK